jgi:hypothetical protein
VETAVAVGGLAIVGYRRVVKPWHERWGATDEELLLPLPGDDLVAEPADQVTRAVTIAAEPEDVWPWLVQIGADRAGFYSYDWLENLFGLGIHSADDVVEAWQQREVGDVVYANRAGTGGWCVMDLRPNEALVLATANMAENRPLRRDEQLRWEFLWTFALRRAPAGGTRLLVRERTGFGSAATRALLSPLGPVSFIMSRRMMLGIKARAEAAAGTPEPHQADEPDEAGR